jgi:hypothetical protein
MLTTDIASYECCPSKMHNCHSITALIKSTLMSEFSGITLYTLHFSIMLIMLFYSHIPIQGGSSIAVAAVSKDRLNDELLLVVLDRIVDKRAKVMDMCGDLIHYLESNPTYRIRLIHYLEWSAMFG